jgi:hypothetical protein
MRKSLVASISILLLGLFLFGAGMVVQASSGTSRHAALLQDEYPYPVETFDDLYPVDTQEPLVPTAIIDEAQEGSPTPLVSSTSAVNRRATEDAEMRDTLGTQLPSATAAPSITPANTQTIQVTITATSSTAAEEDGPPPFQIDWGFFWAGFAVPVLGACGVVLYLLDRRPDLFRPRPKT